MAIDFNPPDFLNPSGILEGDMTSWSPDAILGFIQNNPWLLILGVLFAIMFYYFFKELANAQSYYGGRA